MVKSTLPIRKHRSIYKADTTHDGIYQGASVAALLVLILQATIFAVDRYFALSEYHPTPLHIAIAVSCTFCAGLLCGVCARRFFSRR